MFDQQGVERPPQPSTVRRFDPPRRVFVDIHRALSLPRRSRPADCVSLRIRSEGLRLEGLMPADLHAWIQLMDAQWLAVLSVRASNGIGRGAVTLDLVVAADCVSLPDGGEAKWLDSSRRPLPPVGQ